MTRQLRTAMGDERGQTVVLLAISMPLLLALLLLVIDGGRLYVERERLLSAARLSAQAGVSAFDDSGRGRRPATDADVRAVVDDAIARNLPGESVRSQVDVDRPTRRVDVRLEQRVDAFLGRVSVPVAGSFSAGSSADRSSNAGPLQQATTAPAPTPFRVVTPKPPCYRAQVGPLYLPPGLVASTISIDGAVAPDGVFFAAPSSAHRLVINATANATTAAGQSRSFPGRLTMPGQAISVSAPIYGGGFDVIGRYTANWGTYAQCP